MMTLTSETIAMNGRASALISAEEMTTIIMNDRSVNCNTFAKRYDTELHWSYFIYAYAYAIKTGQPVETVLDSIK